MAPPSQRDYSSLTQKQKAVVDALVDLDTDVKAEIAREAGCSDSYVNYVEEQFGHVVEDREATLSALAADGEGAYEFSMGITDTFKMIRILPNELSREIYEQIRLQ